MREQAAARHIRGRGIEIGAAHFPTVLPPGALVTYVDRMSLEKLRKDMKDVHIKDHEIVVDDAGRLDHFEDASLDFVIANHVLEHCQDPIGTMFNWTRVLRRGGIAYVTVPEKTQTFDAPRAVTTMAHLEEDYVKGEDRNDEPHYREWHSVIDKMTGAQLDRQVEIDLEASTNIHFHVFDVALMRLFIARQAGWLELLEFIENGAEVIWILRKK